MYVDAFLEKEKNQILIVERDNSGKRQFSSYATKYVVYWPSSRGKAYNIHGQLCDRLQTSRLKEFQRETNLLPKASLHEGDINPIFRCLYDNYKSATVPNLHVAFFDIEVDFDPEKGFSPTDDPFNPVTAISLYLDWQNALVTLCIAPKHMSDETAWEITKKYFRLWPFSY